MDNDIHNSTLNILSEGRNPFSVLSNLFQIRDSLIPQLLNSLNLNRTLLLRSTSHRILQNIGNNMPLKASIAQNCLQNELKETIKQEKTNKIIKKSQKRGRPLKKNY